MSCFLLSMNCKPCPLSQGGLLQGRYCTGWLRPWAHSSLHPGCSTHITAHAWLALSPWPDLGVAWLLLSCEVKGKRACFPYNRSSFSCLCVFQMQNYFNYMPSTQEINYFLECLVWQEQSHHQGRGSLSLGSLNSWSLPFFPLVSGPVY